MIAEERCTLQYMKRVQTVLVIQIDKAVMLVILFLLLLLLSLLLLIGHLEVVKYLVSKGGNIHTKCLNEYSPLYGAAFSGTNWFRSI